MSSSRFWHGFADMHTVAETKVVIRSGAGVWLEDTAGTAGAPLPMPSPTS
jgi:adenosylmethionine-8-amino-7-oxononanoate aminotransferase